jgi:type VI secretion system protein ImpF
MQSPRRSVGIAVTPSVFDRLLDDAPASGRDSPRERYQDLRALKAAVARDLEALLNTRREALDELPVELREVRRSLVNYGIPDLTHHAVANPDGREAIRQVLEASIATYETRLAGVRVFVEPPETAGRRLRFRVDATLEVPPAREPVRFAAELQVSTRQYVVRDGD